MEQYSKNLCDMAGFIFALNLKITVWVIVKSPSHKFQTSTNANFVQQRASYFDCETCKAVIFLNERMQGV